MLSFCFTSIASGFWHQVINFVSLALLLLAPKRKEIEIFLNPGLIKVMGVIFKCSISFLSVCHQKNSTICSQNETPSSPPVFSAINGGSIYRSKNFCCLDFFQFRISSTKLANIIYYLLRDIQLSQLTFLKIDPAVSFCTKSFYSPKNAVILKMSSPELLKIPLGPALH